MEARRLRGAGPGAELTDERCPLGFPAGRYLRLARTRSMPLLAWSGDRQHEGGAGRSRGLTAGEKAAFPDTLALALGTPA